jgi:hypothetical protein
MDAATLGDAKVPAVPKREASPLRRAVALAKRAWTNRLLCFSLSAGLLFAIEPPTFKPKIDMAGSAQDRHAAGLSASAPLDGTVDGEQQRALEDEILHREALRLGLSDGDPIVRRRLIQRALFLAEDLGGASREPTEHELRQFFEERREQYRPPAHFRLVHVFAASAEECASLLSAVLDWQRANPSADKPPRIGRPFPTSRLFVGTRERLVVSMGETFAADLDSKPIGEWIGPLQSKHGFHLVKISERTVATSADFEQAEPRVRLDYLTHVKQEAVARFLKRAAQRYDIQVAGETVQNFDPSRRIAPRSARSSEDG